MAEQRTQIVAPFGVIGISLENLAMYRGDRALFFGVSASIGNGDVLWVRGDNGIGKTTLLGAISGLLSIDEGRLNWSLDERDCSPGDVIAYQPHQSYAKGVLSALEDLAFWSKLHKNTRPLKSVLRTVGLHEQARVRTTKLSAGQKRRLAFAKLIISDKPVWVLDEPVAALDKTGVALIDGLVTKHIERGGAAIIASHGKPRSLSKATRLLTLSA